MYKKNWSKMKEKKEIADQFFNERLKDSSLPNAQANWNEFKHYTKKRIQKKYLRNTSIAVVSVLLVLSFLFIYKNSQISDEVEVDNNKTIQKKETPASNESIINNQSNKTIRKTEPVKNITLPDVKKDSIISSKRIIFDKEELINSHKSDVVTNDSVINDSVYNPGVYKQDTSTIIINKKVVHVNKKTIIKRKLFNTDSLKKRK